MFIGMGRNDESKRFQHGLQFGPEWVPEIGAGIVEFCYSDVRSHTIVGVERGGRTLLIQRDTVKLLNGANSGAEDAITCTPGGFAAHFSGRQRYSIVPNPDAPIRKVSIRGWMYRPSQPTWKSNNSSFQPRYVEVGQPLHGSHRFYVGERTEYRDLNF